MRNAKNKARIIPCALSLLTLASSVSASTLCVNPSGWNGCYKTIQAAVNHSNPNDVIKVAAGIYPEMVTIGKPLTLSGDNGASIIDASGKSNGIFVNGLDNPGLKHVTVSGFTIINANFEGVLVVSTSDFIIHDSRVLDNDKSPGLSFQPNYPVGCPGQPSFETEESGDCGGAIHLIGVWNSIVSGNLITGNADGILLSDETGETHDNLITRNQVIDNPLECGIVLASHPRSGQGGPTPPAGGYSAHFGVTHNTVSENVSSRNGVQIGGSGVGLFSDGFGKGLMSGNVVIANELTDNGLGGVAIHSHVGPSFGLPADNFDGNVIIANYIARNLADQFDTATPGSVGINISSGGGGSPIYGTVISANVIRDEDVDVAVNTPNEVHVHLNDLLGGKIGVAYVCAFDKATACTGTVNATENYWGCATGPGGNGCSTASDPKITTTPALASRVPADARSGHH
jgi:hypothetical protein